MNPSGARSEDFKSLSQRFNFKKTTQSLNYFATKEGGTINKMKALKLLFLADRYHLRKYGRFIANNVYYAMRNGPVPSEAKESAEGKHCLIDRMQNYSVRYIIPVDIHYFTSIKEPDMRVFSKSDEEALAFAWNTFGHLDTYELRDVTHKYPEWKKHENLFSPNINLKRVLMYAEDFLEDPCEPIEPCFALNDDNKVIRRKYISETAQLESIWV